MLVLFWTYQFKFPVLCGFQMNHHIGGQEQLAFRDLRNITTKLTLIYFLNHDDSVIMAHQWNIHILLVYIRKIETIIIASTIQRARFEYINLVYTLESYLCALPTAGNKTKQNKRPSDVASYYVDRNHLNKQIQSLHLAAKSDATKQKTKKKKQNINWSKERTKESIWRNSESNAMRILQWIRWMEKSVQFFCVAINPNNSVARLCAI